MHRGLLALALVALPSIAAADPDATLIGGWFGPRLFSQHSVLGYIDDAPAHPMLNNTVEFGGRVSREFIFPWLYPEFELALAPTNTTIVGGAASTNVFWFEPRVNIRFELMPGRRIQPFLLIGGGAPIALSSARKTFNSGIIGDGYIGGGVRLDTTKGFVLRFDARLALLPGVNPMTGDNRAAFEGDIGLGIEFAVGGKRAIATTETVAPVVAPDRDGDGIPDAVDKCPDRPEDKDGFEDADGCPDIDNDGDRVLDIADKCPNQPETYNGFEDEDGCPDSVPPDVASLHGTIEGLLYAEGETAVRDSGQPALHKFAKILQDHPGVKIVLVGHTDDREAKAFATPVAGQPPPDIETIATELAQARAEAVRQALVAIGVRTGRIFVKGVGAAEPVADNATTRGRLANRRVELKLFVPQH